MAQAARSVPKRCEQPVGQRAAAARVFEEAADHGAQPDHHGDESQGVAEAGLDGLQHLIGRHAGRKPQRHAGDQQRQEGVQLHHQNEDEEKNDSGHGQD